METRRWNSTKCVSSTMSQNAFLHPFYLAFYPAPNVNISGQGENKDGDEKARLKHKNGCCLLKFTTLPWKFTTRQAPGLVAGGHVDCRNGNLFPMRLYCSCCFPPLIHLTLVTQPFLGYLRTRIAYTLLLLWETGRRTCVIFQKWAMEPPRDASLCAPY